MSEECRHSRMGLASVDYRKFPEGPAGMLICCVDCGSPIRLATRKEWHDAYLSTPMGERYPRGVMTRDGEIVRECTQDEHERWLAGELA